MPEWVDIAVLAGVFASIMLFALLAIYLAFKLIDWLLK